MIGTNRLYDNTKNTITGIRKECNCTIKEQNDIDFIKDNLPIFFEMVIDR